MKIEKNTGRIIAVTALVLGAGLISFKMGWRREGSGGQEQPRGSSTREAIVGVGGTGRASTDSRSASRGQGGSLAESGRYARINEICAIENEAERKAALDAWIAGRTPGDLAAMCLELWDQPPLDASRETVRRIIRRLAELDPVQASALAEKLPAGEERDGVMQDVAIVWGGSDFHAAVEWVKQWPEGDSQTKGLVGVGYEVARTEAASALDLAASIPAGEARDAFISHAVAQYAVDSPEAAAEWARQLKDSALRERAVGAVATEWSDRDPIAAANFAIGQLPAGRKLEDTLVSIVQRWAQFQPDAAREWVEQFPNGPLRSTALEQIAQLRPKPEK